MNHLEAVSLLAVEDDPIQQASLGLTLQEMGYPCVGMEKSGEKALHTFRSEQPDIVLLDIQLKGKMDGIQLGQEINDIRPTPLIYLTSFDDDETYRRARHTLPVAYLIKPVKPASLQSSMEWALRSLVDPKEEIEEKQAWKEDILLNDSIFVKIGDRLKRIRCQDIRWIETSGNRYCKIVTYDREAHVRASLLSISEKLAHLPLVRIHRSYLINLDKIEGIHETHQTVDLGDVELPLGDAYKQDFFRRINRI